MLDAKELTVILAVAAIAIVLVVVLIRQFMLLSLWFRAKMAEVPINLLDIVGVRLRKVPPKAVVPALITAKQAGLELSCEDAERAYLRGADLTEIVSALIRARNEGASE